MMQRRRIREKLELACARPPATREPRQPSNSPRLSTAGPTLAELLSGSSSIAIAGPAGCGKSRFLEDGAAALAAPPAKGSAAGRLFANATDDDPARPVIHLRLCKPPGPVMDELPAFGKYEVARLQADLLADAVLPELGVPVRPCALRLLSARAACFFEGKMPSQWMEARLSRVDDALRILYEEADQLSRERRAERIPADRAAPVIMIDNADAFVGSAALAIRGGSRVFASLLTRAQWYQDAAVGRDVKTILAGSPVLHTRPELTAADWDESKPVARIYQLGDPDVPSALKALQGAGHSREMAENIVAALSTRVGLLQPHLDPSQPHGAAAARTVLQQQLKDIEVQLQRLCKNAAASSSAMLLPGQALQLVVWRPSSTDSCNAEDAVPARQQPACICERAVTDCVGATQEGVPSDGKRAQGDVVDVSEASSGSHPTSGDLDGLSFNG